MPFVPCYGLLAQLVEHIVHIDGVTGSSPVQTTHKNQNHLNGGSGFLFAFCPGHRTSVQSMYGIHRLGAEPKRCQWQMKRGGSVVSNKSCKRQRSRTPIANLTERAKRSETVGRMLKRFAAEGMIEIHRGGVMLKNLKKLEETAR